VSYDTFQDMSKLVEHSQEEGWIWPVAYPVGTMLRDYEVIIYSNKIAFDSRGVITYRSGPGEGTDEDFRRAFQTLAASR
jgi:hypothetical protein